MHFRRLLGLAATLSVGCAVLASTATAAQSPSQIIRIGFDKDATGAPVDAPCGFSDTKPLRGKYSALGVLFRGPSTGSGGAILNQCGGFGIDARSGSNFLAFNDSGYAKAPERIIFSVPQVAVSIYASAGPERATFTMRALRGTKTVAVDRVTTKRQQWGGLVTASSGGIDEIRLDSRGDHSFVFDDLVIHDGCDIKGTDSADVIEDDSGSRVICSRGGGDTVVASGGVDVVFGGSGPDNVSGGGAVDLLVGGKGRDVLLGGAQTDTLRGGAATDLIRGDPGADEGRGGRGSDFILGGSGADRLSGNAGFDVLRGARGEDRLRGGPDTDACLGGPGRDRITGCERRSSSRRLRDLGQRAVHLGGKA
jgi:Ca2+-binding RTX toxin-like protein